LQRAAVPLARRRAFSGIHRFPRASRTHGGRGCGPAGRNLALCQSDGIRQAKPRYRVAARHAAQGAAMKLANLYGLAARAVFALFAALTAWYCLLAYLPFTYQQVHQGGLLPWLDTFARIHPWIRAALFAALTPVLWSSVRGFAAVFLAGELAQTVYSFVHPVLPALQND